ncbi:MAG TPA: outer membrane beta-barrel protein, partial [Vicinamibacteria bacterium]
PAAPKARVVILGGAGLADARVRREGGEVIVTFDVGAEAVPASPKAAAPIDDVHVEKVATLAVIHVKVAPEVPFEVAREPGRISLTFGEEAALDTLAPPPPPPVSEEVDVRSLVSAEVYRGLFPSSLGGEGDRDQAAASDLNREGLQVGPVHLRPSILTSYVAGDYTLHDTPDPVSDRYLQIEPRVAADMPLLGGEVTADYGVRLRFLSQFDEINTTSHLLNAGLEMPLGSRTLLRLNEHFASGVLESTEVDPGQEYFFNLSPFRRNDVELGARVDAGARIFVDGSVGVNDVRFEEPQGFFSYESRRARLGAGLTFGDNLRGGLYYGYERIPAPADRPLVASTANSIGVAFDGDFGAVTRGQIQVDYLDQSSPDAAAGGQAFRGLTGTLSLTRQLSPSAQLTLRGRRDTDLSAFEGNAFYVSTGGQVLSSFVLAWSLSVNAGVGYQENQYKTVATSLDEPREDTILGWTLGLSRPLGSFAFVRADYRRDRRRSNLPGFDITTDGFMLQVGLGLFGTSVGR